jgi:peptidyl-prolyl cis-trans isomerase C
MTFKPARLLLALIAVAAMPAFAQNVAVVNGKPIPTSRADAFAKAMMQQSQQPDSPALRAEVRKSLIAREVMMQEAIKKNLDKSPLVKEQLDLERQRVIIQAMVRDFVTKNPIKDEEIKAEYDKYKAQMGDKEYHVRHILAETDAEAKAIIAKLKAGSKFEDLAKTSKDTGTANTGGDLDWAPPSAFPKVFSDAFVALQKGGVTETPVQTPNGFHVIKLDDTRPAKVPPFEEVKPQLADRMYQIKLQAYQEQLVSKAVVK